MAPLVGYLGGFYLASDVATAVVDEAVGTGNDVLKSFTLDNGNVAPTGLSVSVGGVVQGAGAYAASPDGTIAFGTAPSDGKAVTATYNYFASLQAVGGFYNWAMDVSCDELDNTDFTSTGWRHKVAGLRTFSVTAEQHWVSSPSMFAHLTGSDQVIFRCYTDEANSDYYIGWGYVTGISPKVAVDALVDETVKITGTGVPARVG